MALSAVTASEPTPADGEPEPTAASGVCSDCGTALAPDARFCRACGLRRLAEPSPTSEQHPPEAEDPEDEAQGPRCGTCGALRPDGPPSRFCRRCGALQQEPPPADEAMARGPSVEPGDAPGRCRSCGSPVGVERTFCRICGTARVDGRSARADGLASEPGWRVVVRGLTRIWEGGLTIASAVVAAAAVLTLFSLAGPGGEQGGLLRLGLLGAASVASLVGLGLMIWGDALCVRIPRVARARVHATVVLALSAGAAVLGAATLVQLAQLGFELDGASGLAPLATACVLALLARQVAFSVLLRRLAFALRHYRIAQGAVGFIVFTGVGLAVVGLVSLLFRSAAPAARTFGELLALAFGALVAIWALSMIRRSRDLVQARLP